MKLVSQDGRELYDFGNDQDGQNLLSLLITNAKFQDGPSDAVAHNDKVNALLRAIDPSSLTGFELHADRFDGEDMMKIRRSLLFQAVGRHLAGRFSDTERDRLIEISFFPMKLNRAQHAQVCKDLNKALDDFAAARERGRNG